MWWISDKRKRKRKRKRQMQRQRQRESYRGIFWKIVQGNCTCFCCMLIHDVRSRRSRHRCFCLCEMACSASEIGLVLGLLTLRQTVIFLLVRRWNLIPLLRNNREMLLGGFVGEIVLDTGENVGHEQVIRVHIALGLVSFLLAIITTIITIITIIIIISVTTLQQQHLQYAQQQQVIVYYLNKYFYVGGEERRYVKIINNLIFSTFIR